MVASFSTDSFLEATTIVIGGPSRTSLYGSIDDLKQKKVGDVKEPLVSVGEEPAPSHHSDPRTVFLVNTANTVTKAVDVLLPSVYGPVGAHFHLGTQQLGTITCARLIVQAAASLVLGLVGIERGRVSVLSASCLLCGLLSVAVGCAQSHGQVFALRAATGAALACVLPAAQSVLVDLHPPTELGRAFGICNLATNIGAIAGGFFATTISAYMIGWLAGWRFAFIDIGLLCCGAAAVVFLFGKDPRDNQSSNQAHTQAKDKQGMLQRMHVHLCAVAPLRTFHLLVAQGAVGSMPWNAFAFLTLWLQAQGHSNMHASALCAVFCLGTALGSLLGGRLCDVAAKHSPVHGPVYVGQASIFLGLPLSFAVFIVAPLLGGWAVAVSLFVFGLAVSWCGPINSILFADIVPSEHRTSIFAFDRALEGGLAAGAAPLAGYLAENLFGYDSSHSGASPSNAHALGQALFWSCAVPWALCLCVYSLLHRTYPKDRLQREHVLVDGSQ